MFDFSTRAQKLRFCRGCEGRQRVGGAGVPATEEGRWQRKGLTGAVMGTAARGGVRGMVLIERREETGGVGVGVGVGELVLAWLGTAAEDSSPN